MEIEQKSAQCEKMLESLNEVETALSKLEKDTYGRSESCGQPVNPASLEALPYAIFEVLPYTIYCVKCKARSEFKNNRKLVLAGARAPV